MTTTASRDDAMIAESLTAFDVVEDLLTPAEDDTFGYEIYASRCPAKTLVDDPRGAL